MTSRHTGSEHSTGPCASIPPLIPLSGSSSSGGGGSSISTAASSSSTSAAPAAGSSVSCRDLPPPSPQGALPGTGRGGREITTSQLAADPQQGTRRREGRKKGKKDGREGIVEEVHEERQHPGLEERRSEDLITPRSGRAAAGRWMSATDADLQETGAAPPGPGPEEPLMERRLTLQRGVFNQCHCPPLSICVCVCLPLEPEGRLLMVAAMATVVMLVAMMMVMVMMMMRWQWRCSRDFWLSRPRPSPLCLLKDSLR
ncbi:uncharacterized protein LOC130161642 [Seriola aureovittata]|uniref:uncharacterized protein LOC130161642 n=1 Tax=Seriola aureovittata TaxID=2871759 RepID=UPI0024BE705C|nr:uncharacterized protein LOC130161642 [Seriola aureovittata]